mmetsp:Transcript_24991/g.30168  ORF Transcript_24991/g.30168 Transcript_24991/m.30168 type:complete len:99 (-) Transcript_24991:304-600(-)
MRMTTRENELLRVWRRYYGNERRVELNGGWKLLDASLLSLDGSVEEKKDENTEKKHNVHVVLNLQETKSRITHTRCSTNLQRRPMPIFFVKCGSYESS